MKDWMVRALKTFVQAFLGVAVPELVAILTGGLPQDVTALKAVMIPILCAALAAGIAAAWNIINEQLEKSIKE